MDRKTEPNQTGSLGVTGKTASLPFDGPWIVNPFRAQVDSSKVDGDGDLVPVCQMLWPTKLRTEDETGQIASTISAVPFMIAALLKIEAAMMRGGDGRILDTGWNITKLNEARALVHDALDVVRGDA